MVLALSVHMLSPDSWLTLVLRKKLLSYYQAQCKSLQRNYMKVKINFPFIDQNKFGISAL